MKIALWKWDRLWFTPQRNELLIKGFPGVCTVSNCHHKQIPIVAGVNLRSELESALNGLELLTALDRA